MPVLDKKSPEPTQQLSLFDSICIMVGIIIGVGIYESAPIIAAGLPNQAAVLGIWLLGAFISLCGALCYAELASTYPKVGGDYHYLNRAYGSWAGYLFAWSKLIIVRPGSIAAMAFPFASYLKALWSPFQGTSLESHTSIIFAVSAVISMTVLNCVNVATGKRAQNILTVVKCIGLFMIFLVAMLASQTRLCCLLSLRSLVFLASIWH